MGGYWPEHRNVYAQITSTDGNYLAYGKDAGLGVCGIAWDVRKS